MMTFTLHVWQQNLYTFSYIDLFTAHENVERCIQSFAKLNKTWVFPSPKQQAHEHSHVEMTWPRDIFNMFWRTQASRWTENTAQLTRRCTMIFINQILADPSITLPDFPDFLVWVRQLRKNCTVERLHCLEVMNGQQAFWRPTNTDGGACSRAPYLDFITLDLQKLLTATV
jgi:hypothetical protein